MKINTKIRYGLRAMIEIASSENISGILQKDIAKNQNISTGYLDHIITALKANGLIANVNGKRSGYKLLKRPEDITMKDIYTSFEPITILDCLNNETFCDMTCDCQARDYWADLKQQIEQMMGSKTLDQVLKKQLQYHVKTFFLKYENQSIILPSRFLPDKKFLKYHNNERFQP